ncbi:ATP-dependent Zn protease [Trichosporon asahii var. asahii CBS 2479]|uniref:ATP-dependent Zn protease n=1 Tax=Trichosporon asahii var. asahii (strain ATCC 90039 / CBS 2479 / JCM 2466 / KCTC 7840 / NBRC 103889/ NCYC 2677 / UAMH 7654) TaxID=1186058 RepID=J6F5H6_TRIAS|nr:ATP-dependent Zn protease [Trichosporon asahii var. asahii CBS 2479]EJT50527.1 ATP-dependent Zn protease [Trichosporon asahii var. asahii CBS 2479]
MLAFFLIALAAVHAAQIPFFEDSHDRKPGAPEEIYIKQFSALSGNTGVALQSRLEALYANSTVLTTQTPFDLLAFADESGLKLRQRRDLAWLTLRGYSAGRSNPEDDDDLGAPGQAARMARMARQAGRARAPEIRLGVLDAQEEGEDSTGNDKGNEAIFDSVHMAAWELRWEDTDMLAIVAQFAQGFSFVTQWHLVSPHGSAADSLFATVAKATSAHPDVVWVFDRGWWEPSKDLWRDVRKSSWDDVILDADFKKNLREDYTGFLKGRKTYKELGVPWKRGLIFLGPPGNGKTSALKAIMGEVGVPSLYVRSVRTQENLATIFKGARDMAPCLLIFEDLDSMIDDDNRSYFLNEVDGMDSNDGLLMIATTNHFDRLDPGLSNRPSRFDRKYQRRDYAVYWQKKLKGVSGIEFPNALLDEFAAKTSRFSFACMKEAFVSSLLAIAGDDKNKGDKHFPQRLMREVKHLRKEIDDGEEE